MGIIATAGALAGAGQGITEVGQQGQKMDMATKMNQLAQAREEAITRLKGEQEKGMQQSAQTFQAGQEQIRIGAASAAAGAQRESEAKKASQHEEAATGRSRIQAQGRVDAAKVAAQQRSETKGPPKIWSQTKLNTSGFDPNSKLPTTSQKAVNFNNFNGRSYVQIGDKFVPWDANANAPANDAKAMRRPAPGELQDLLTDPLGKIPDGPNAGLTKADVFEQAHGYLPAQWTGAAASKADPKLHPQLFQSASAPSGPGPGYPDTGGAADNAAQSGADEDEAPQSGSSSMSVYNSIAQ
jgi:hypothetical protein